MIRTGTGTFRVFRRADIGIQLLKKKNSTSNRRVVVVSTRTKKKQQTIKFPSTSTVRTSFYYTYTHRIIAAVLPAVRFIHIGLIFFFLTEQRTRIHT